LHGGPVGQHPADVRSRGAHSALHAALPLAAKTRCIEEREIHVVGAHRVLQPVQTVPHPVAHRSRPDQPVRADPLPAPWESRAPASSGGPAAPRGVFLARQERPQSVAADRKDEADGDQRIQQTPHHQHKGNHGQHVGGWRWLGALGGRTAQRGVGAAARGSRSAHLNPGRGQRTRVSSSAP